MIRTIYVISLWLRRMIVAALLAGVVLGGPALYVETQCLGGGTAAAFEPALPEASRRPEAATYIGFPQDYVAHAHAEYAQVIAAGDPHDYAFIPAVTEFWQSLCPLAGQAAARGGFDGTVKRDAYLLGARFTAGMLSKAAYEETLGRVMTMVRGPDRTPLDAQSAERAAAYADFLRQLPWHQWRFGDEAAALTDANSGAPRDWERTVALNVEYRVKALAAGVAARVFPGDGIEDLTLRAVVTGPGAEDLARIDGVTVIGPAGGGTEIEIGRREALPAALVALAEAGADFAEIAGNDDILISVRSAEPALDGAVRSMPRQGFGDYRHLIDVKVPALAQTLRGYAGSGITVESAFGY
ncbi:MAG: hypothetical protein MUE98_03940 [Rhodobacteraceae bacterium]|jgi:hypothetical protein|nr:hypothetical protein [Paracoccaceae bacterium]